MGGAMRARDFFTRQCKGFEPAEKIMICITNQQKNHRRDHRDRAGDFLIAAINYAP
jgi:hypothetical protein